MEMKFRLPTVSLFATVFFHLNLHAMFCVVIWMSFSDNMKDTLENA